MCIWPGCAAWYRPVATRPVARFQGLREQNTFLRGKDFCFGYMAETDFSTNNNKIVGTKIFGGTAPECPYVAMGMVATIANPLSPGIAKILAQGLQRYNSPVD